MEKVIDILLDCQIVVGVELIVSVVFAYLHLVPDATNVSSAAEPGMGRIYDILMILFYI